MRNLSIMCLPHDLPLQDMPKTLQWLYSESVLDELLLLLWLMKPVGFMCQSDARMLQGKLVQGEGLDKDSENFHVTKNK